MADPQRPGSQKNFKYRRTGVSRKTAEERAAAIEAEALRQANQVQPQPSQTQQDGVRRAGPGQRDPRTRTQNPSSVFSSTGAVIHPRVRGTQAVSGTEELIQRSEGDDNVAVGRGTSNKGNLAGEIEDRLDSTSRKASGRNAKSSAKKDEIIYKPDDAAEDGRERAVDIEDIDRISISSGESNEAAAEDDVVLSRRNRTPKPRLGLRPMRAARDMPPSDDGQSQTFPKGSRKWKGKKQDKTDKDHGDTMDLDEDEVLATTAQQTTPPAEDEAVLPSPSPTKRRRKSITKAGKPQFETIEERAERERYTIELRKLKDELSSRTPENAEGVDNSKGEPLQNPRDGRLYLFQFPPLTPMLINPSPLSAIKAEPTADSNESTTATAAEGQIKEEEGTDSKPQPTTTTTTTEPSTPKLLTALNNPALPAGLAGKLNVHRSGKVTLEWGSSSSNTNQTNLEVKWGSEVDFLQDVVLTSSTSAAEDGSSDEKRKAWALSQVRTKFVVVPDWARIYE
jgi:RNA polymerase III RPC4